MRKQEAEIVGVPWEFCPPRRYAKTCLWSSVSAMRYRRRISFLTEVLHCWSPWTREEHGRGAPGKKWYTFPKICGCWSFIGLKRQRWVKEGKRLIFPGFYIYIYIIPEYSGINKGQRIPDRSKTAQRKPPVKCFLTVGICKNCYFLQPAYFLQGQKTWQNFWQQRDKNRWWCDAP